MLRTFCTSSIDGSIFEEWVTCLKIDRIQFQQQVGESTEEYIEVGEWKKNRGIESDKLCTLSWSIKHSSFDYSEEGVSENGYEGVEKSEQTSEG